MTAAQENEIRQAAQDELQPGAVGRVLREARETYRQDLATVSQQLRIRTVYLKAIEEGHYQELPGSTYAVGFVRSYAEYLGLDPNEIVRRFRDEAAEVNRRTKLVFPMPAVEARVPSGALVLIALMVAVLAYGGWYYLSDRDRSLVDLVPSVPESLQSLVGSDDSDESDDDSTGPAVSVATADAASVTPSEDTETDAPAASTNSTSTATTIVDTGTAATTTTGATSEPVNAEVDEVDEPAAIVTELDAGAAATDAAATTAAEATAPTVPDATTGAATTVDAGDAATDAGSAAAEPTVDDAATTAADAEPATMTTTADVVDPAAQQVAVIPEAPRVPDSVQDTQDFGVAFGGSRVVIVARMESFLRVRDADGNEIWSRLLRSGDRYLVPEREGLTLTVGNAGGVDVFVDGRKAPALGAVGVGASGISLDPERLAAGTARP